MKDHSYPSSWSENSSEEAKQVESVPLISEKFDLIKPYAIPVVAVSIILFIFLTGIELIRLQYAPVKGYFIEGNKILSKQYILQQLRISDEDNFGDLDPYILTRRLQRVPWVKTVRVRRKAPNHLKVFLIERVPKAYFRSESKVFLVDEQGVVLPVIAKEGHSWNLPVITHKTLKIQAGDILALSGLNRAFQLMDVLKTSKVLPFNAISEIDISDPVNLRLITIPDGVLVNFGYDRFKEKVFNLYHSMPKISRIRKQVKSIDLRYIKKVIVEKKKK
ncbi:MAG: cell division protein FtsQ [bacterium]|jgi:cell division protein FtsQ